VGWRERSASLSGGCPRGVDINLCFVFLSEGEEKGGRKGAGEGGRRKQGEGKRREEKGG
jgi:hypothetical protein